jgi:hypothetical protein
MSANQPTLPRNHLLPICDITDHLPKEFRAALAGDKVAGSRVVRLCAALEQDVQVGLSSAASFPAVQQALQGLAAALEGVPVDSQLGSLAGHVDALARAGNQLREAIDAVPASPLAELLEHGEYDPVRRLLRERVGRPDHPTKEYCLALPKKVRWITEEELDPRLWHLLDLIFDYDEQPIPFTAVREVVHGGMDIRNKTIRNEVYDLNTKLRAVLFPWGVGCYRLSVIRKT